VDRIYLNSDGTTLSIISIFLLIHFFFRPHTQERGGMNWSKEGITFVQNERVDSLGKFISVSNLIENCKEITEFKFRLKT
jgi:hypothetical protein